MSVILLMENGLILLAKLIQWKIFYVDDKLVNHLPAPFLLFQWSEDDEKRREDLKSQGDLIQIPPSRRSLC